MLLPTHGKCVEHKTVLSVWEQISQWDWDLRAEPLIRGSESFFSFGPPMEVANLLYSLYRNLQTQ